MNHDAQAITLDRTPLFCVPVPGLSNWCNPSKPTVTPPPNGNSNGSLKRKMTDEGEDIEIENTTLSAETAEVKDVDSKRTKPEHSNGHTIKSNGKLETEVNLAKQENLSFPLPNSSGLPCLVKVCKQVACLDPIYSK